MFCVSYILIFKGKKGYWLIFVVFVKEIVKIFEIDVEVFNKIELNCDFVVIFYYVDKLEKFFDDIVNVGFCFR